MPLYPNPAGGTMEAANDADAASKGWSPAMGTFGAQTYSAGGGAGSGAVVPQTAGGGIGGPFTATPAQSAAFGAPGVLNAQDLAERKRQFDATLEWQKQMWANQGLPQLVIQQRAQQLQQDEFAFQSQMAQQSAALQKAGVLGYMEQGAAPVDPAQFDQQDAATKAIYLQYNGNDPAAAARKWAQDATAATTAAGGGPTRVPTLAAQQQAFQQVLGLGGLNLQQQQTALDAMKTAASLGGPSDWLKAANFGRGVAATDVPLFLRQLASGAGTTVLGGGGSGATPPTPQSMQTLAAGMGFTPGVSATPTDTTQAANAVRNVFMQGGGGLAPQALEGLTKSELGMFTGAGSTLGFDPQTFLDAYSRSRIGQGAAQSG